MVDKYFYIFQTHLLLDVFFIYIFLLNVSYETLFLHKYTDFNVFIMNQRYYRFFSTEFVLELYL